MKSRCWWIMKNCHDLNFMIEKPFFDNTQVDSGGPYEKTNCMTMDCPEIDGDSHTSVRTGSEWHVLTMHLSYRPIPMCLFSRATPLGGDSGLRRIFCPNRAVWKMGNTSSISAFSILSLVSKHCPNLLAPLCGAALVLQVCIFLSKAYNHSRPQKPIAFSPVLWYNAEKCWIVEEKPLWIGFWPNMPG